MSVEDPQFVFFIRQIPWAHFSREIGFVSVDFPNRYDFALSFAGPDRPLAEAIFRALEERDFEVFYDANEQHRIVAQDVEEYLRPIYHSEARYIIPLLSKDYPKRIWTKFESEHFKDRFREGAVIPIAFADAPLGMLDIANKVGFLSYDPTQPIAQQVATIAEILAKKVTEQAKVLSEPFLPGID